MQVKKLQTDLTKKNAKLLRKNAKKEKRYDFLLGRMYFTGNDVYQSFLVFTPMLSSLTLDSNKNFITWISTRILPEKNNSFDTNLEPTMFNLANGRVILKLNKSALVQKNFSYCIVTSF